MSNRTGADAAGIALRLRAMADEEERETVANWLLDGADLADENATLLHELERLQRVCATAGISTLDGSKL